MAEEDVDHSVFVFNDAKPVYKDLDDYRRVRPHSSSLREVKCFRTGIIAAKGSIQNKVCPYLSYYGDIGPGFLGAVPSEHLLTVVLESWSISYRAKAATLKGIQDYLYDTRLEIYEARPDLDFLMPSDSDSDRDSFQVLLSPLMRKTTSGLFRRK